MHGLRLLSLLLSANFKRQYTNGSCEETKGAIDGSTYKRGMALRDVLRNMNGGIHDLERGVDLAPENLDAKKFLGCARHLVVAVHSHRLISHYKRLHDTTWRR